MCYLLLIPERGIEEPKNRGTERRNEELRNRRTEEPNVKMRNRGTERTLFIRDTMVGFFEKNNKIHFASG